MDTKYKYTCVQKDFHGIFCTVSSVHTVCLTVPVQPTPALCQPHQSEGRKYTHGFIYLKGKLCKNFAIFIQGHFLRLSSAVKRKWITSLRVTLLSETGSQLVGE